MDGPEGGVILPCEMAIGRGGGRRKRRRRGIARFLVLEVRGPHMFTIVVGRVSDVVAAPGLSSACAGRFRMVGCV